LAKKLGLNIDKPSKLIVTTANGSRVRVLGQITEARIIIQHVSVPVELQVIESPQDTLLLGVDWCRKTKMNLDFSTQTASISYVTKRATFNILFEEGMVDERENLDQVLDEYEEEDLDEYDVFLSEVENNSQPKYVMNIMYDHQDIIMSQRINPRKEMYKM
jgi:hypothetical protein